MLPSFMLSLFKKFKQFHLTRIKEWFSLVQKHLKLGAGLSVENDKGWSLSIIQSSGWLSCLSACEEQTKEREKKYPKPLKVIQLEKQLYYTTKWGVYQLEYFFWRKLPPKLWNLTKSNLRGWRTNKPSYVLTHKLYSTGIHNIHTLYCYCTYLI